MTLELDQNANSLILAAMHRSDNFTYNTIAPEDLGDFYPVWQERHSIATMVADENFIPSHEKEKKLEKINYFYNAVLANKHTDTTLFGMRKDSNSPIVIIDGNHRAIGIYKAWQKKTNIPITLRLFLIEGSQISELEDYNKSIPAQL